MIHPQDSTAEAPTIVLVDGRPSARRRMMIQEALMDLAGSRSHAVADAPSNLPTITVQSPDESEALAKITTCERAIILIVVEEDEISTLTERRRIPRVPCASVQFGYNVLDQIGPGNDLYYVVGGNATGLDVIAMLLSGARGVLDGDCLGSVGLWKALLTATKVGDKRLNRLSVGRPCDRLEKLIEMARQRWQLAVEHWCLLLALAEIPVFRLPSSYQPKQKQIAEEIGKYSEATGYVVSSSTPRKLPGVLGLLAGELGTAGENENDARTARRRERFLDRQEMFELPYLPLYAQSIGLPSCLLSIRGIDQSQLSQQLYKGLRSIEILRMEQLVDATVAHLTLPRNL